MAVADRVCRHCGQRFDPTVATACAAGVRADGDVCEAPTYEKLEAERDNMITREAAANRAVDGMRAEAAEFETALCSAADAAGVSVDILTAEIGRLKESERRYAIDRDALLDERDAMRAVIEHARWWRDHPGAPGRKLIDALNRLDTLEGGDGG